MKILLFDTWITSPQIETTLEIAESHIENGDEPIIVNVSQSLEFQEWLNKDNLLITLSNKAKLRHYTQMCKSLNIKFSSSLMLKGKRTPFKLPSNIKNMEDLKDLEYDGMDLGMALASSLISKTNDLYYDIIENRLEIEMMANSSLIALESFKRWLEIEKPDLVYIRNGRTVLNRPLVRYCELSGINFRIHDRAGLAKNNKYSINTTYLTDRTYCYELIENHWKTGKHTEQQKVNIANEFYAYIGLGDKMITSFTDGMIKNTLPVNFDPQKHNVVFFTSSNSESVAIDKEHSVDTIFDSQYQAVEQIANWLHTESDLNFYLRLHPNTKKSFPKEYKIWLDLAKRLGDKLIFIDSFDEVDSYALAKNCDKAICYMTTIGIETVILDTPSIIVGNPFYKDLGSNYVPLNKEECQKLISDRNLEPKNKIGAYKYGYFMNDWGIPYKNFKYVTKHHGEYRGVNLNKIAYDNLLVKSILKFRKVKTALKRIVSAYLN